MKAHLLFAQLFIPCNGVRAAQSPDRSPQIIGFFFTPNVYSSEALRKTINTHLDTRKYTC